MKGQNTRQKGWPDKIKSPAAEAKLRRRVLVKQQMCFDGGMYVTLFVIFNIFLRLGCI